MSDPGLMALVNELHELRNMNASLKHELQAQAVRIDEMLEKSTTEGGMKLRLQPVNIRLTPEDIRGLELSGGHIQDHLDTLLLNALRSRPGNLFRVMRDHGTSLVVEFWVVGL